MRGEEEREGGEEFWEEWVQCEEMVGEREKRVGGWVGERLVVGGCGREREMEKRGTRREECWGEEERRGRNGWLGRQGRDFQLHSSRHRHHHHCMLRRSWTPCTFRRIPGRVRPCTPDAAPQSQPTVRNG